MTCKRSEQCDHADLCRFAQSDDYNLLGGSCFTPKDPQTNDEWRRTCSTEEFAEWIFQIFGEGVAFGETHGKTKLFPNDDIIHEGLVVKWLKQPHGEVGK